MSHERELLKQFVADGKLMQLATRDENGLWVCNVWHRAEFSPDLLYFTSNVARTHSHHVRDDGAVAGSIVHQELDQLGQKARWVTYRGEAVELPTSGIEALRAAFVKRWPNAAKLLDADALKSGETPMRLYQVEVREWILVDEINLPESPRRVIPGS